MSAQANKAKRILISYRHSDSRSVTNHIYAQLKQSFGDTIFMDAFSSESGDEIGELLNYSLRECPVLIVIIGKKWLRILNGRSRRRPDEPDYVRWEVECALTRNITVIPVLVEGAKMPPKEKLPESLWKLVGRVAMEVRSGVDFERDTARLSETLEKILYGRLRRTFRHLRTTCKPMAEIIGWISVILTILTLSWLLISLVTQNKRDDPPPLYYKRLEFPEPVKPVRSYYHIPAHQLASRNARGCVRPSL